MISDSNNIYLVTYAPGTCGTYIMSLIWCLIENPKVSIIFSKHGNAHQSFSNLVKSNWDFNRNTSEWKDFKKNRSAKDHLYRLVKPVTEKKALILPGHEFPDFEEFIEMYPNAKFIFIQRRDEDIEYIKKLFYYKVSVDSLRLDIPIEKTGQEQIHEETFNLSKFINPNIPEIYKDRTCVIKFRDILNEHSIFLESLGKFVNREITDKIQKMHIEYLSKQPIDLSFAKIAD